MPKSIEDIDRQIAALKEQKKRQQAQIAQKKREGLRSCKELIGEKVVNAFDNWTSIDLDLFAMYISEHADEIVTSCSTSETDLYDALKRNIDLLRLWFDSPISFSIQHRRQWHF